jgi:hypothetical protein
MLAGADIQALERAVRFRFGLFAAVAGLVIERIVGALRTSAKVFLSCACAPAAIDMSKPRRRLPAAWIS